MPVTELMDALCARDVTQMSAEEVRADIADLARVQSWVDGREVAHARRVAELAELSPSIDPAEEIAMASRGGRRAAQSATRRAEVLGRVPQLGEELEAGGVSAAHVDALGRALRRLDADKRGALAARGDALAAVARASTPERFEEHLEREVRRLQADGGVGLLRRQKRAARLRMWTDRASGMFCYAGQTDPETGLAMRGAIENAVNTMFRETEPDTCPDDPIEKQQHLAALALARLLNSRGTSTGTPGEVEDISQVGSRIEMLVVIDLATLISEVHEHSIIDPGDPGIQLPVDTYRRMACLADIVPIVLNTDGVVVDQGRTTRLATRAQRRALRAMYETCAIPGCTVHSRHCEPHHLRWWRNGGRTDIDNLLPLCSTHHHAVHEGGWLIALHADRSLTITYPDGQIRTGPPPGTARKRAG